MEMEMFSLRLGSSRSGTVRDESSLRRRRQLEDYNNGNLDLSSRIVEKSLTWLTWFLIILTFPFCLLACFKVVKQYERAVIFRLGRLKKIAKQEHGVFFILPCIENYEKMDLRSKVITFKSQSVLTKDSVTVGVEAIMYYRITNAVRSITKVVNAHASTKLLAMTTLRCILGQHSLQELLHQRNARSLLTTAMENTTASWGITVERVDVLNVKVPFNLQRALAAEGEANRLAKAKFLAAEGEHKAARALKSAAEVLSPTGIQLRYLQTLTAISGENNQTILVPLPMDALLQIMKIDVGGEKKKEEGQGVKEEGIVEPSYDTPEKPIYKLEEVEENEEPIVEEPEEEVVVEEEEEEEATSEPTETDVVVDEQDELLNA